MMPTMTAAAMVESNGAVQWDNEADDLAKARGIIVAPNVDGQASVTLIAEPG